MLGKKVFFIKEFLKQDKVKNQVDFEEFLTLYTKEKLDAIINNEIHNDRNEEKNLSGVHFVATYKDSGELVSKDILSRIIQRIRYEIRDTDILVEWDEGEFIILLLECTIESAQKVSFLLKSIIESKEYDGKKVELNYTITMHYDNDSVENFLSRLDAKTVA